MSAANQDDAPDLAQANSLLSDEELALIAGEDGDQELSEGATSDELDEDGEDDTDEGADDVDADDEPAAGAGTAPDAPAPGPAAPAPAAADLADAGAAVAADEGKDDAAPPAPIYKVELPADFAERLKAAEAKEEKAEEDYENGDIDGAERRRILREARAEIRELDSLKTKADTAREMAEQAEAQAVHRAAFKVFDAAKEVGIDYTKDPNRMAELTSFAKIVEDRNPGQSPEWILREAHRRVLLANDIEPPKAGPSAPPAPSNAPAPKPDPKAGALAKRKPAIDKAQPSLSHVPGGDGPGDVGGEYQDLDTLDGEAYEAAVERLRKSNPARYNAYMESR